MIKSCETSYLYVVIANGITTYIALWEIPTLAYDNRCLAECQRSDFLQSYVAIPLAKTTSNLFHNILSLGSLLLFKINF